MLKIYATLDICDARAAKLMRCETGVVTKKQRAMIWQAFTTPVRFT
jgi:hypothetical protein